MKFSAFSMPTTSTPLGISNDSGVLIKYQARTKSRVVCLEKSEVINPFAHRLQLALQIDLRLLASEKEIAVSSLQMEAYATEILIIICQMILYGIVYSSDFGRDAIVGDKSATAQDIEDFFCIT